MVGNKRLHLFFLILLLILLAVYLFLSLLSSNEPFNLDPILINNLTFLILLIGFALMVISLLLDIRSPRYPKGNKLIV